MAVHVFVGPTLTAAEVLAAVPGAIIHPPVAHGDLMRLEFGLDDVVVIIDGYYHQAGSVRHKEVLALLAAQVPVIGCASMGALRAAELHAFGMVGHGVVFDMYREGLIDADDEVAVAHTEGPEYRRFSEPLVNIRHAVAAAGQAGVLTVQEASQIVATASSLPYTARGWRAIERVCASAASLEPEVFGRLRAFLAAHPSHADLKAADAIDTLRHVRELVPSAGDLRHEWASAEDWRSQFLYDWQATFKGTSVDDIHVSHGEVIRYCQIYREDFPPRWQEFALGRIEESRGQPTGAAEEYDPTLGALAAAAQQGVVPGGLSSEQIAEWLTADEAAHLAPQEALVRILVRSYRPPRKACDMVTAWPDLIADATIRTAIAETHAVNAEVASWEPGQSIAHIHYATLRDHLAKVWQVGDADDEHLLAAARDRGFSSLEEAVGAARLYFLRSHFLAADRTLSTAEMS